jgi:hypothetical protein
MPDINLDLGWILYEAMLYAGTERGRMAFERLAMILRRPAQRIARVKLEETLPRNQVGIEAINSVVKMTMYKLYKQLHQYEPGTPVIPWFTALVNECAQDFLRRG